MAAKIRAAVAAKRDPDFVIIARTDARGVNGFDDAVDGRSSTSRPGPTRSSPKRWSHAEEFERFAKAVPVPSAREHDRVRQGPAARRATLGAIGYRMVLFPLTAFRVAMKAAEDTLRDLHANRARRRPVAKMHDAGRNCTMLGYTGYEQRDKAYSAVEPAGR